MLAKSWLVLLVPLAAGSLPGAQANLRVVAPATLWVVAEDAGAGVDFTDIQDAVDAAAEGDGILVRSGSYDEFVIDGKSLVLIEEPGGAAMALGQSIPRPSPVIIRNLAPTQTVVWLGLSTASPLFPVFGFVAGDGLVIEDCQGTVWIENAVLHGDVGGAALEVRNSSVVLVRCDVEGGAYFSNSEPSTAGIEIDATSTVSAFDCTFTGARGGTQCTFVVANDAGAGALVSGSLFASGCTFQGGHGADDDDCFPNTNNATDGGDGCRLDGAGAFLRALDGSFSGGAGGMRGAFGGGSDGVGLLEGDGTAVLVPGAARSLTAESPAAEGTTSDLLFQGEEGDFLFGIASPSVGVLDLPGFTGPLLPGFPFNLQSVGFLPAGGEVTLGLGLAELGAGVNFLMRILQPLNVTPGLAFFLGAPSAFVVLDDSFVGP